MKKAYWIFAVVVVAFLGDRIAGAILSKITQESKFRYSRLYGDKLDSDILFVGNSRGLSFYQPYAEEKTGLKTSNISYNGMPITLALPLVEDYMDHQKAPKVMVVDISLLDSTRMDNKLITQFKHYLPFSERLSSTIKQMDPKEYYASMVSHLYRYNSEVFQRTFFYWKKSDKDWLLDRVISPSMVQSVQNQKILRFSYDQKMLEQLAEMTNYAAQKGTRVELVVNPYFPGFIPKLGNLDSLMNDINKATGLIVKNFENAVTEESAFGDYQHVNKNGAKQYLDKLMEAGILSVD